ncbi:MAG TPA: hypothetical protein PLT26_13870 [Anaerolineaceae bacterium]|nr:hypothetical protein [Anaerolineaceae bacterium]HQH86629.1 hypothetical protein [Anaerolineaceae bacterium]
MKNPKFALLTLAGLLFVLLIGGCIPIESVDTEITLQTRERWQMGLDITVAPDSGMTVAQLETEMLSQFNTQTLQSQGIQVNSSAEEDKDGRIVIQLIFEGQGLDLLNQTLSGGSTILREDRQGGRDVIVFEMAPVMQFGSMDFQLTLKGARVISSNGVEQGGNQVTWTNPTQSMQAVLAKPALFDTLPVILLIVGGILAFVGLIGLLTTLGSRRVG